MAALKGGTYKTAADVQKAGTQALYKAGGGDAAMKSGVTRAQVIAKGVQASPSLKAKPAPTPPKTPSTPSSTPSSSTPSTPKPAKPATAKLGNTSYQVRTPTSAELKGAQEYRAANPNAKPEDVLKAAQLRGKQQASVDADIAKFNKPEELNKQAPVGSALRAQQDAQAAKKAEEEKKKAAGGASAAAGTTKESYDAYDIVLEYLISGGHVESISEAHYVMLEMDSETIQSIVEQMTVNVADVKGGTQAAKNAAAGMKDKFGKPMYKPGVGVSPDFKLIKGV